MRGKPQLAARKRETHATEEEPTARRQHSYRQTYNQPRTKNDGESKRPKKRGGDESAQAKRESEGENGLE